MKTDVIIVGGELDGLAAAARLVELGHSLRVFMPGGGSLHYAPGGIHLLGYAPREPDEPLTAPLDGVAELDERHPYRLLGAARIGLALDWFFAMADGIGRPFRPNGGNVLTLTAAGQFLPVYGPDPRQADFDDLKGRKVAIVRFRDHRDFPAGLVAAGLRKTNEAVAIVESDGPGGLGEALALARAFDRLDDSTGYFAKIGDRMPKDTEVVLFPAVLGLGSRDLVGEARAVLGRPCYEVPTLPPSVPGMRLLGDLEDKLEGVGVLFHIGARVAEAQRAGDRVGSVVDDMGRAYEASAFVLASGGVLMGGLEVDSHGIVGEPVFGLDVFQTAPLDAPDEKRCLDALHRTGVTVDERLRPRGKGADGHDNVFVTGRTLGHWNPAAEVSAEGVSIATGWAAAEAVHRYLEG